MKRNNSQLLFGAGGASGSNTFTATYNNNINLNDSGSGTTLTQSIGAFSLGTVVTLGGVISGKLGLTFQLGTGGGQGKIILDEPRDLHWSHANQHRSRQDWHRRPRN